MEWPYFVLIVVGLGVGVRCIWSYSQTVDEVVLEENEDVLAGLMREEEERFVSFSSLRIIGEEEEECQECQEEDSQEDSQKEDNPRTV